MYFGKCTIFALTYPNDDDDNDGDGMRGASESLSPYKDADPTEWNCQDGFQCIMCLRYKFFSFFLLWPRLYAWIRFNCETEQEQIVIRTLRTQTSLIFRWSFSLHMQLLALYFHCMHSLSSSFSPFLCAIASERCSIFTLKIERKTAYPLCNSVQMQCGPSPTYKIVSMFVNGVLSRTNKE